MNLTSEDILVLRETDNVEFKKASGKDGKGELPNSFWDTYSAFANTDGGDIFLGIEENQDKTIKISGIQNPEQIIQRLFDLANNRQKVSSNLIDKNSIETLIIDNKKIIRIHIARASRKLRPVYTGENPLKGSYRRRNEGDYLIEESAIKRMLAEQGEDSADARILSAFGIDDLDLETLAAYKNVFAARMPTHPFLGLPIIEFLRSIGAWNRDREEKVEGLTLAGLLMFGKLRSILDAVPSYIVDYQERPEAKAENRWIDRITTDGSWSGNLYDFYRKVYPKITQDLKIPFKLEGATRIDETPIHEALREAFVNALIHADFLCRVSILVVKRPDMFVFRNPGLMRIPIEQALQGGVSNSDCRNRNLQKMFQFIGACEQAGSGIPKIYQNWKQQHWRNPKIIEKPDPEQTIFELHMFSLLPQEDVEKLDKKFGDKFRKLPELERVALIFAETDGNVDHKRLKEISPEHPADISKALNHLVKNGFLSTGGAGRGMSYYPINSEGLPLSSEGSDNKEQEIAKTVREKKKISTSDMQNTILQLCDIKPQSLKNLADLLGRSSDHLRQSAISNLILNKKLVFLYQHEINHPEQAYLTPKLFNNITDK